MPGSSLPDVPRGSKQTTQIQANPKSYQGLPFVCISADFDYVKVVTSSQVDSQGGIYNLIG
jgi:hypothetical protein